MTNPCLKSLERLIIVHFNKSTFHSKTAQVDIKHANRTVIIQFILKKNKIKCQHIPFIYHVKIGRN
jgi:hypothetical protein